MPYLCKLFYNPSPDLYSMEWAGPDRLCHLASPLGSPTDDLVSCCEHYCFVHSCDVLTCGAMRAWWNCRRNLHQVFEVLRYCRRGLPCAFARIFGAAFLKYLCSFWLFCLVACIKCQESIIAAPAAGVCRLLATELTAAFVLCRPPIHVAACCLLLILWYDTKWRSLTRWCQPAAPWAIVRTLFAVTLRMKLSSWSSS